ncbi:PAS domain-containing sensor histidine kinase [Calothrix sp. CCY 0018]|uniref:PAS domain-containing sensor histidine kinase n=1 Tax=Calothrix sp. CCY 0018 TaxID=3103864 RepID=UPI0039C687DF
MNFDKFVSKVKGVRQQSDLLQNRITKEIPNREDLLVETVEQLNTSLEELHVAEEELLQQNEQLVEYQQEINNERQRYQELFDFAPDAYLITDTYGKILEANRAASQLLTIERKKLAGKLIIIFVPQATRREFRKKLRYLYERKQIKDWEIDLQNYQKNSFNCEISASSINDKNGRCVGMRWLLRDVSARKLAEAKIRFVELQNFKLKESSRLKSQILAVLSHELRTPLNAVIGFSDVLLRLNRNQFTPQSLNIIKTIIRNGKELLKLINNMLDFAGLEEGKLTLHLQKFNIKELIGKITDDLYFFANQKNICLETHINIQNVIVINDPIRLQQLLSNLVYNAIKFTETGSVSVELEELNEDKIIITIQDTGIGISDIDLKHIFQAFRQVNQTITRTSQGTGLGLAIVKDLLVLMGGTITVESLVGEGSTFRVELPRAVNS